MGAASAVARPVPNPVVVTGLGLLALMAFGMTINVYSAIGLRLEWGTIIPTS